jgi:hypothetical protein
LNGAAAPAALAALAVGSRNAAINIPSLLLLALISLTSWRSSAQRAHGFALLAPRQVD